MTESAERVISVPCALATHSLLKENTRSLQGGTSFYASGIYGLFVFICGEAGHVFVTHQTRNICLPE